MQNPITEKFVYVRKYVLIGYSHGLGLKNNAGITYCWNVADKKPVTLFAYRPQWGIHKSMIVQSVEIVFI